MRLMSLLACAFGLLVMTTVSAQEKKSEPPKKEELKQEETPNLLKPTNKVDSWRFEQAEGGKGKASVEDQWIVFKVTEITGTDWHVQAVQAGLDLKEGTEYKLTFEYKSDTRRAASVNAMIDEEDWHEIGLHEDLYAGTTAQKYETTFRATGVNTKKKNRITFALGTDKGALYLKNVRLEEVKK